MKPYSTVPHDLTIAGKVHSGLFDPNTNMGAVMHASSGTVPIGSEVIEDGITYRVTHTELAGSGVLLFRVRQPASP